MPYKDKSMRIKYAVEYAKKRRIAFRERHKNVIQRLGGKCEICGGEKYLELHHKRYPQGNLYRRYSWETAFRKSVIEAENDPENFAVLCHKCHGIITLYSLDPEVAERLMFFLELEKKRRVGQAP